MNSPSTTFRYRVVGAAPTPGRVSTSRTELRDLGLSFAVLTFDLVLIFGGLTVLFGSSGLGLVNRLTSSVVLIAAAAALSGFVAHELAHKIVAQRRGYWAEFRMWTPGLLLSIMTAYFGVLWGAPGATVVSGMPYEDTRSWGRTSIAGPMANVAFAGAFYAASIPAFLENVLLGGLPLYQWLLLLAWINGWFGTFNLLPFGPLDGRKVLRWGFGYWLAGIVVTGAVAAVSAVALFLARSPFLFW